MNKKITNNKETLKYIAIKRTYNLSSVFWIHVTNNSF